MTKVPLALFVFFLLFIGVSQVIFQPVVMQVQGCRDLTIKKRNAFLTQIQNGNFSKEQILQYYQQITNESDACVENVSQKTGRPKALVDMIRDFQYTGCEFPPLAVIEVKK